MTQWTLPDLSSDLYSLGLVSTYMDSVMSEVLGHKAPPGPRNNTWPNREQSEQGMFGVLGDTMPFDPAGESQYFVCVKHPYGECSLSCLHFLSVFLRFIYLILSKYPAKLTKMSLFVC